MMSIQIASDLHLEMGNIVELIPRAPYLALLGDIGDPSTAVYEEFLVTQTEKFQKVLVVLGNHEYYKGGDMEHTKQIVQGICDKYPGKLILMDRTMIEIDGCTVLGCTLWSHIKRAQSYLIQSFISDFRCIHRWSVPMCNQLHAEDVQWLRESVATATNPVVILTHHAPYEDICSRPEHRCSEFTSAFGTDGLDDLFGPRVLAFAHGHTHHNHRTRTKGGTLLVANQYGTPGECTNATFNPSFVLSFETTNE